MVRSSVLAILSILLAISIAYIAYGATVYVKVIGPDNTPVANVLVEAWQDLTKVSTGTTNESGVATLDVDTTKNVTFIASLGGSEYIINTYSAPLTEGGVYELNATALHKVYVATNTTYAIPVTFEVPGYGTVSTKFNTNYTMYVTGKVKLVFPNETTVQFFKKLKFVKIVYNGYSTNETTLELTITSPLNITAYYAVYAVFPLPWWWLILIIAIAIACTVLAVIVGKGKAGKKVLETRKSRYLGKM